LILVGIDFDLNRCRPQFKWVCISIYSGIKCRSHRERVVKCASDARLVLEEYLLNMALAYSRGGQVT
jgi:hypothetical protein